MSLIIPVYNEESNIPALQKQLTALFGSGMEYDFEVVLVDDHSADRTQELGKAWVEEDDRVRLIRLSRNCGSHAAFHAGLVECTGDAAIFLAADLQDPPELILDMAKQWQEGSDIVWAVRAGREGEKASMKLFAQVYYSTMRRLGLASMPAQGADFFLLDRKVVDAYLAIPEKNTSVMGLILWMGFRQSFLPYVKQARASGVSKWTFAKKVKLFVDSIVSFSFTPIRVMSVIGALFALIGFVFAAWVVLGRLLGWVTPGTGYAAIMTALMIGMGLIMLMLGVIGEYLWRTFDEARGRPRYIVEDYYPELTGGRAHNSDAAHIAGVSPKGVGRAARDLKD